MSSESHADDAVLAAKTTLKPAAPRANRAFQCLKCGRRQNVDGNCPEDGLPLRLLSSSET